MHNERGYSFLGRRRFILPLVIIVLLLLLSAIVQYLWNAIMPGLLHTGTLDYPDAVGLLLLCRILFGKLPWGRPHTFGKERWMKMDTDQRKRFREEFEQRCKPPREYPID